MSKIKQNTEPSAHKMRYSISHKLNTRLFFRLLSLFLTLNIIICIITAVCITVYSERTILNAVRNLPQSVNTRVDIRELGDAPISTMPGRFEFAQTLFPLLPDETANAIRGLRIQNTWSFADTVESITYIVRTTKNGQQYELTTQVGGFIIYFIYAFAVLCAFELLTLISRSAKDRRLVRRTLDPITEFARAAQSLNDVSRQLEHDKIMALAGKLDGIDVSRLDTRIQVDDLQEELKNVAIAINSMLDRINESYAAQARFVSDASHELRTPISVIQGYANMLDRWGKEDEKTLTESISAIKDEANNMKGLVEQLLFLARGDSNTIQLVEEPINLAELIGEVVSETKMLDVGREFITRIDDLTIKADRSLMKQALRILVDNAVKYTDEGGKIKITATYNAEYIKVSVSDDGVGINPEILPQIFTRFVRADESRNRATGGAGLGLSIAHWIVKRHDGHMETLSREGIGTQMTLALPQVRLVPHTSL